MAEYSVMSGDGEVEDVKKVVVVKSEEIVHEKSMSIFKLERIIQDLDNQIEALTAERAIFEADLVEVTKEAETVKLKLASVSVKPSL